MGSERPGGGGGGGGIVLLLLLVVCIFNKRFGFIPQFNSCDFFFLLDESVVLPAFNSLDISVNVI